MCKKILPCGLYCKRAEVVFGFCKSHIPEHLNKFECCVCYSECDCHSTLRCTHCICNKCLWKLRDDVCPVCRTKLEGKRIGNKLLKSIDRKKQEDKIGRETTSIEDLLGFLFIGSLGELEYINFQALEHLDQFIIIDTENFS